MLDASIVEGCGRRFVVVVAHSFDMRAPAAVVLSSAPVACNPDASGGHLVVVVVASEGAVVAVGGVAG